MLKRSATWIKKVTMLYGQFASFLIIAGNMYVKKQMVLEIFENEKNFKFLFGI